MDETQKGQEPFHAIKYENGEVKIGMLRISMSKIHRAKMCVDIALIILFSTFLGWTIRTPVNGKILNDLIGVSFILLGLAISICKTALDFRDWMYTMNFYQDKLGERYKADISEIYESLIKPQEGEQETESVDNEEPKEDEDKKDKEGV